MRRQVTVAVAAGVVLAGVVAGGLVLVGGSPTTGGTASSPMVAPGAPADAGAARPRAEAAPAVPDATAPDSTTPDTGGRDVVRTAQLTLEVADPTVAAHGVRTAVATAGGIVAEEQVDRGSAWLVVRVPAAGLDRFVDDLAATGTVLTRSARAEDATAQIVDLDGRVATQQASVTRVRALLAQATSVGDVVAIESELASREADLESLQRKVAGLRDRVALSTVTVELRGATTPASTATPGGFGSGLGAGWSGLKAIGTALATAAGFLLPFLPVIVVAAGVVGWVVRRRRRRERPGSGGGV